MVNRRNAAMVEQYAAGTTIESLAKQYRLGTPHVRLILRKVGLRIHNPCEEKVDRNAAMVAFFESGGMTLEDIGEAYGVSRERVRQVVRREGSTRAGGPSIDVVAAVRALREATSFSNAASRIGGGGRNQSTLEKLAIELGMYQALYRLYRLRLRKKHMDNLRRLAASVGRPLRRSDFSGPSRLPKTPTPRTLEKHFGSIPNACKCAGVAYRKDVQGRRSHKAYRARYETQTYDGETKTYDGHETAAG
jgi:Mor family transcriptional regulator